MISYVYNFIRASKQHGEGENEILSNLKEQICRMN